MSVRLIVEWTRSTVRAAVVEAAGRQIRLRVLQCQAVTGAGGEPAGELSAMLQGLKGGSAHVIGVVPREQVITRVVKFPTLQPAELAQMTELYAKAQLPYPREQTVMDSYLLNQQDGFSTVAIVACQREVIDRQLAFLRDAGLPVGLLTVSSWGVLGWYQQIAPAQAISEPTLVLHVDETRADLVLIAEGKILSSRSLGQGAQEWQALPEAAELLALEIERSRAAIRKELPSAEVRSLTLTGVGPLAQWKDHIARRAGLPVTVVESQALLKGWPPGAAAISPVVIGGLASGETRGLLNLSPPEMRVQVRHRQQVKELVLVGVLLVAVLAAGAGFLSLQISRRHRVARHLEQVLAEITPVAKQLQEKSRLAESVGAVLETRIRLAAALAEVFRYTPPEVSLEVITAERSRGELALRGSADSTQGVLNYVKALEALEGIEAVDLKYSTRRMTPLGERIDFEVVLHQPKGVS